MVKNKMAAKKFSFQMVGPNTGLLISLDHFIHKWKLCWYIKQSRLAYCWTPIFKPFENWANCLVFQRATKTEPAYFQPILAFNHSKTGLFRFLVPHCIYECIEDTNECREIDESSTFARTLGSNCWKNSTSNGTENGTEY